MGNRIFSTFFFIIYISIQGCSDGCGPASKLFGKKCSPSNEDSSKESIIDISEIQSQVSHPPVSTPTRPTEELTYNSPEEGVTLRIITPEQLVNHIKINLAIDSYDYYQDSIGQTLNSLIELYGPALGGIDFTSNSQRDPSIKTQTLLAVRAIAWNMARDAVALEYDRETNNQTLKVLTKVNIHTDRPMVDSDSKLNESELQTKIEAEKRWEQQLEDLYWSFYSRPPSDEEIKLIKETFLIALDKEPYISGAWITIIYALMSTQEFWNL